MKSATMYLSLNALLVGCFVVGSGNSHADEVIQEVLPPPAETSPSAAEPPMEDHLPEDACTTKPHLGEIDLNDGVPIVGDSVNIAGMAMARTNIPYQHPAPEVVLRFGKGCTDAEPDDWSLSSRDAPRSRTAIPHGPLSIELRMDVAPIAFVELMLDGKPLKPTDYATTSPLRYELPCPATGQHWLQARYLSGNLWSYYSTALRFDLRLPNQPRIIAASDFNRDPTPLTRSGLTSITTGSIKVHLANVARDDSIVAYVDGKPVSTHLAGESCCRIIDVAGSVTPGVHTLAVRAVGCPGSCSITSKPSNEIEFHYYEADAYLLKPGAGCDNKRSGKACPPTPNAATTQLPNRVSEMDEATEQAWNEAEEQAAYEAAGARYNAAKVGTDENGVKRAQETAKAAQTRATHGWNEAASRIAEVQANADAARAEAVIGPSSPFVFASAAHFPIHEFGLHGESRDREGVVIYEDMTLSFDKEGHYQVRFVLSTPAMPVLLNMQFQIQPYVGGPWYTITLKPLNLPPTKERDGTVNGTVRDIVQDGQSEILRRCYGEMGQNARIRRSGTARIGFGVDVP